MLWAGADIGRRMFSLVAIMATVEKGIYNQPNVAVLLGQINRD